MNPLRMTLTRWLNHPPVTKAGKRRFSTTRVSKVTQSYVCGPLSHPLVALTTGQLVDRAERRFGYAEAVVSCHQNIRKTFFEVKADVDRLASGFVAMGLKQGDRIGIWGPNSYEWYITMFASGKAGLILVNINPAYRPEELRYCLNKVGVKALVSAERFKTQDYYGMMEMIMPEISSSDPGKISSESVKSLESIIMISDNDHKGAYKFKDICSAGGSEDLKKLKVLEKRIQIDDPVNIQFTSGTTGQPKGACLSHHNIVNNGRLVGYRMGYDKKPHRVCVPVPLYHCFGNIVGGIAQLYHGGAVVFPSFTFEAPATMKAVEEERCTCAYGTPTMFVDMLKVQSEHPYDVSSLETGIMAGAPCPRDLCTRVINDLNMRDFSVCYGLTETSPVSFQHFPTDGVELKTTTIGYPLDGVEAKVVDVEGNIVPTGQTGELCTRGFSNMLGYWEDEEKTAEVITQDRWFHTGDQAVIYENGYAQIVGRIKDMIIRGGENIYPREIEEALHNHPDILEAHVVGVPDPRMGEELCAWVKTSQIMNPEDVKNYCRGKIAHFKIPRYIHFVDSFPSTVTGKIQKFKMREESVKIFQL